MGKLKIKQRKKAFVPYTNQQAHMFAQSIQNCQKELKEMEKKAYEDGFTVGEDWSNTINTVTTMMALRRLYGFLRSVCLQSYKLPMSMLEWQMRAK